MGNTESSSQNPSDGRDEEEVRKKRDDTVRTAIKAGAAVAGTALLALGAWNLASSSLSGEHHDSVVMEGKEGYGGSGGSGTAGSGGSGTARSDYKNLGGKNPYYRRYGKENQNMPPRTIKVLTYNVCFREDICVHERMESIGKLIQKHSPDVILFQEVTPNIFRIFQESEWLQAYKCSISPEKAIKNGSFLLQLSKIPVEMYYNEPILGCTTGRGLSIAEINIRNPSKNLVIATSHFKSRNHVEMHSEERVNQALQAINFLHDKSPNVIFGGDTNWNEDSDGRFPLLHGWIDAWEELRPGEEGFTFDTKANPMLERKRPVQGRLDRFCCKLKDFKLVSVDIVGSEAIDGLYYHNLRGKQLPVLPSDHYGLLLAVTELTTKQGN